MSKQHRLLLGAHMSIAGGLDLALTRGASIDCTTIQLFTKSNRRWLSNAITDQELHQFKETRKKTCISPIMVHSAYLINIGSSLEEIRKKSILALIDELQRCEQLGIEYLILHPGSAGSNTQAECLDFIVEGIDQALAATHKTILLLENMAGQGSVTCSTFEQLSYIRTKSHYSSRLGICLDTCHAFAAGYDFRTLAGYQTMIKHFDDTLGLKNLKAIHLNDSKKELGSKVDRHEEIGKGILGLKPFEFIMNDDRLFDVPKILETPNDTLEGYAQNITILKGLIKPETKERLII